MTAAQVPPLKACVSGLFTRRPAQPDLKSGAAIEAGRGIFERRQVPSGQAVGVGPNGLEGSVHLHNSVRWADKGFLKEHASERALLIQTSGNLKALHNAGLSLREALGEASLQPGFWGENLFLESLDLHAGTVCIGDELSCWRAGVELPLRLQVASPRCPCAKVDQMMGKTFTVEGVRANCAGSGHAGFFCRPVTQGDLQEGDIMKLAARTHPTWTIARVSALLYGNPSTAMKYEMRGGKACKDHRTAGIPRGECAATDAELHELASLEELAICEWKEYVFNMLDLPGIGRYRCPGRWNFEVFSGQTLALMGSTMVVAAAATVLIWRRRSTCGNSR
mmetsp:Transcript_23761/g.38121  ORF Transcript_23761/g.38121 Transcript_23761/m.38121 type:complete len:336 (+) Transcript_23761:82-1089(+)